MGHEVALAGVHIRAGILEVAGERTVSALMQRIYKSREVPGRHRTIEGIELLDKVINIDQSPIGRTPRSNPATYTGVFDHIRKLFAQTNEAKVLSFPRDLWVDIPGNSSSRRSRRSSLSGMASIS